MHKDAVLVGFRRLKSRPIWGSPRPASSTVLTAAYASRLSLIEKVSRAVERLLGGDDGRSREKKRDEVGSGWRPRN